MNKRNGIKWFSGGWLRLALAAAALSVATAAQAFSVTQVAAIDSPMTYSVGDEIYIIVTFDEDVALNGDPTGHTGPYPHLVLEVSPGGSRQAEFVELAGPELYFSYTVQPGDFTADLGYTDKRALKGNNSTLTSTLGSPWSYITDGLPAPASAGSLAQMSDVVLQTMDLVGPASLAQNEIVNLTLSRGGPLASQMTVTITYPPEISGPSPVYIPANSDTVSIPVKGVMGTTAPVNVQARPSGYPADGSGDVSHALTVIGLPPYLTLEGGLTQLSEGMGGTYPYETSWTVRRWGGANSQPLNVMLLATNPLIPAAANAVFIPPSVLIPAGQDSYTFPVQARDGAFEVRIEAAASNYVGVARQMNVANNNPTIPSASVVPQSVAVGTAVTATFTASDVPADVPGLRGRWVWDAITQESTTNMVSGSTTSHTYAVPGSYTVSLYVTDKDGGMTKYPTDWTVTVEPIPYLEISGGMEQISEGPGGAYPDSTEWTITRWGAGSTGGSRSVTLNVSAPGAINLPTTVTIPAGANSRNFTIYGRNGPAAVTVTAASPGYLAVTREISVVNNLPVISGASVSPLMPVIDEPVYARYSASDVTADLPQIRGTWVWGDGTETTGALNGSTMPHTYTDAGTYTVTLFVTDGDDEVQYTQTWEVTVNPGFSLNVIIPGSGAGGLQNVGSGTVTFDPLPARFNPSPSPGTISAQYRESVTSVRVTALPEQPDANGYDSYHFQFVSDGISSNNAIPLAFGATNASVTVPVKMGQDRDLVVWFSREWMQFDNRGDIDGDGLSDEWEIAYGLNPRSAAGRDGGGGCPSGDRMPNAANMVFDPLITDPSGQPAGGPFAYPIPWSANWTGYAPAGPAFNNRLQFRGQSLNIWDADFPDTDPTVADTNEDGLSDGWCYYFYANAINNSNFTGRAYDPTTLVGSLVIANADIVYFFNPVYDRGLAGEDTDGDGLTNLEEYYLGTNPIDWDTDGDDLPDGWEVLFGTDPLDPTDADANPDQDYMAAAGGVIHNDVYQMFGFDPRTGYTPLVLQANLDFTDEAPNTRPYTTRDEYLSMRWRINRGDVAVIEPVAWLTWSTDPLSPDTDLDGMADGWELYVGLNPADPIGVNDATLDPDEDALPNLGEFSCQAVAVFYGEERMQEILDVAEQWRIGSIHAFTNQPTGWLDQRIREPLLLTLDHFAMVDPGWLNKFWPTDPNDPDTDRDQIKDGAEANEFRYDVPGVSGVLAGNCYVGGGLNPTSADTDGDFLPDFWEVSYAGGAPDAAGVRSGMDGTYNDAMDDYDGDGLDNYQEYLVGTMFHFNYDKWIGGLGYNGYDPIQFLRPAREFGPGNYGEAPYEWDWVYWFNESLGIRFFFQLAEERLPFIDPLTFATCDPTNWDTDGDGMDDYYEMYHGLNPIWALNVDVVGKAMVPPRYPRDARLQPWQVGDETADPDQDGLPNWEEALHPNRVDPRPHHTDPTPYWFTDMSYSESFVNLYYQLRSLPFFWGDFLNPPSYMFSFESNEGFDTDNDNLSDKRELIGGETEGLTDPLDSSDPYRRAALYLDGDAAARTRGGFFHGGEALRTWAVELWFNPEQVATGSRQMLIERPVPFSAGDPLPATENARRNFRLGIDEDGRLFVEYDNDGNDLLTRRAKSDQILLTADKWYHVAGVFDGTQLKLYIDGQLHGATLTSTLPATGVVYGNPDKYMTAPIVVGAADASPYGVVNGGNRYYNGSMLAPPSQPALGEFFKGWIDEIRIWNGPRSEAQIRMSMTTAMQPADVAANPNLFYHYSFSNLPDPNFEPIVPDGFAALNGLPNDGSYPGIPWWRHAADRSTVYDNYLYVPWIENTVARVPINPPFDSVYWATDSTGGQPATNDFPNTANPYGHGYGFALSSLTERNPELGEPILSGGFTPALSRLYNNLLPLRNARADRSIDLWDTAGPGISTDTDSNGDGISDWWYVRYGYDPFGPSIADADPDNDGLSNYWEFIFGTNPHSVDTDGDGVPDGDGDFDGDGLSNYEELNIYRTNPAKRDTDDDGIDDKTELDSGLDPIDSLSPFVLRYLHNPDGDGYVAIPGKIAGKDPHGLRHSLDTWTIEATVRLTAEPLDDIVLIRRQAGGQGFVNYELGITVDRIPYARFQNVMGAEYLVLGYRPIPLNQWTYLGGRLGEDERGGNVRQLALFQDSVRIVRDVTSVLPVTGPAYGDVDIARNLIGDIDEVRVWNYSRSDQEIEDAHGKILLFGSDVARMASLRPNGADGTPNGYFYVPDRSELRLTNWTIETWFKTESPGVILERNEGAEGHSNYRMEIGSDGRLMASLDIETQWRRWDFNDAWFWVYENFWARVPVYSTSTVLDGEWHHASFVFNGVDTISLHIDGRTQASISFLPDWNGVLWLNGDPRFVMDEFASFVRFANLAGPLEMGRGFDGLIDEVRIYNEPSSIVDVRGRKDQKAALTESLVSYFDFDDVDPRTPEIVFDRANDEESGELRDGADVALDPGDNAPIRFNALDILRPKLALYLPLDDGRGVSGNGVRSVEDFVYALSMSYDNDVYAGTLMPSPAEIDFVSFFGFTLADYSAAMEYPELISPSHPNSPFRSFPLPPDSPWRLDSDFDGMPDIFEQYYRLDPNRVSPPERPDLGPLGDLDGDGLCNLYEYYAGTDPTFWDSLAIGVSDADYDSDGDGISNIDEQRLGTHPGRVDTDDDGFDDGEEAYMRGGVAAYLRWSNPADAMSTLDPFDLTNPDARFRAKSMVLDGQAHEIPRPLTDMRRFNTPQWTIEAWVRPDTAGQTGSLIRYAGEAWTNGAALPIIYYELGLANGLPYITFQGAAPHTLLAVEQDALAVDTWTHLAGVWDPTAKALSLYRDGMRVATLQVFDTALSGSQTAHNFPGRATIGSTGVTGNIDHVRIWKVARTSAQIEQGVHNLVQLYEPGQIANFRFDDGGEHAEDFAHRLAPTDLETMRLYALRDITFDVDIAVTRYAHDFDDTDRDGLPDWWENLYFTTSTTYWVPESFMTRSAPMEVIVQGAEEASASAAFLDWAAGFTPIRTAPGKRWTLAPDAAWMFKDIYLESTTNAVEMRMALKPEASRVFINGRLLDLTNELINAEIAWPLRPERADVVAYYVPPAVMAGFMTAGRNRISVEIVNTTPDVLLLDGSMAEEYFNLELYTNGKNYLIRRGDDTTGRDKRLARWWLYANPGSMVEPPLDTLGRVWFDRDYALDTDTDLDGDGLSNEYESVLRTNPLALDTYGNGVADGDEDIDGDGLSNSDELRLGSHPALPDTDDNGIRDGDDPVPASSRMPLADRALELTGGYVDMPYQRRFALTNWTLQAWVKPTAVGANGTVVARTVSTGIDNYRLELNAGLPLARFTPTDYTADITVVAPALSEVQANEWTHLAASFDDASGRLSLFVNGRHVATTVTTKHAVVTGFGSVETRVGQGFTGLIDEVAIFATELNEGEISLLMGGVGYYLESYPSLVSYYSFDDGTSAVGPDNIGRHVGTSGLASWTTGQVEDFTPGLERDWLTGWRHGGTLVGAVEMVDADTPVSFATGGPYTDYDYTEDWWESLFGLAYASPSLYDSHLDTDGDGWDNWSEARYSAKTGTLTRPDSAESVPIPEVSFTFNYSGSKKDGPLVVMAYSKQAMDGDPDAIFYLSSPANEGYTATYPQPAPAGTAVAGFVGDYPYTTTVQSKPPYGGLRQGKNWFFAFIDLDGSGTWDDGEPAGLCERFPYDVGWDKNKVAFTLTDKPVNGFVRFDWPVSTDPTKTSYLVSIHRITYAVGGVTNYTTIFAKSIAAPRNWIHEGDILDGVGTFGGGNPGLDWGGIVNGQVPIGSTSSYALRVDGVPVVPFFQIVYASTQLPMPTVIQPYGGAVQTRAQTEFSWRMSTVASAFELQIVPTNSAIPVYSTGVIAAPPPRDAQGLRKWTPPVHWGDILPTGALTDAAYRWRVRAYQPRDPYGSYGASPSAYADYALLQVDLGGNSTDLGSVVVPLTALYLPAGASIRVQAFDTASFNDVPLAQKTLTGVTALPQTVILEGLAASNPHYIRAYIDQNGNNTRDIWESWGYHRSTIVDYRDWFLQPLAVMPARAPQIPSAPVTILHVDSDQDKIPDAYEYAMSGGLGGVPNWLEVSGLTPAGALGGMRWTDLDGDGLNDLQEFMLGTDARLIDTDGDGIPESQEVALGLSPTRADELRITTLAAGPAAVTWAWVTPEDAPDASVGVYATQSVVPEMERLATDVRYVLERTDSLSDPQWDIVAETETDLTSGTYDIGADMETRPAGFYRIRAILP